MGYTRRSVLLVSAATVAVSGCLDGEADDPANGEDPGSDDVDPTPEDDDSTTNGADGATQDDDGATTDDGVTDDEDGDDEDGDEGDQDADATVVVGAEGSLAFDPETLEIDPGSTVAFVWEGSHHNIAVLEQPDGADWAGVSDTQNEGFIHTHTFDVEGRYAFVCEPHEGADMSGTILVGDVESADADAGESDDDDDDTGSGPGYGY